MQLEGAVVTVDGDDVYPACFSLKCVEVTVDGLEEATNVVSHLEAKMADYRQLPDDRDGLKSAHLGLIDLQNSLQKKQVGHRAVVRIVTLRAVI